MILNTWIVLFLMSIFRFVASAPETSRDKMILCGSGYFDPKKYTCFNGLACPIIGGVAFLRCSNACYSPLLYHCIGGVLYQGPEPPEKQLPLKETTITTTSTVVFSSTTTDKSSQTPWKPSFNDKSDKKGNANHDMTTFNIFSILCIISIIGFTLVL